MISDSIAERLPGLQPAALQPHDSTPPPSTDARSVRSLDLRRARWRARGPSDRWRWHAWRVGAETFTGSGSEVPVWILGSGQVAQPNKRDHTLTIPLGRSGVLPHCLGRSVEHDRGSTVTVQCENHQAVGLGACRRQGDSATSSALDLHLATRPVDSVMTSGRWWRQFEVEAFSRGWRRTLMFGGDCRTNCRTNSSHVTRRAPTCFPAPARGREPPKPHVDPLRPPPHTC